MLEPTTAIEGNEHGDGCPAPGEFDDRLYIEFMHDGSKVLTRFGNRVLLGHSASR